MRHLIIIIITAFVCTLQLQAQNSIDKLVNCFSQTGNCTYTFVVKRNPDNKKVEKVVKVLTMRYAKYDEIRNAFMTESKNGTLIENNNGETKNIILTIVSNKDVRIYKLSHDNNSFTTTILIKPK